MSKAKIQDTINLLCVATKADREIDGLIYRIVFDPEWRPDVHESVKVDWCRCNAPKYTESLEAALGMVPPDWFIELRRHSDGWYARVAERSDLLHMLGSQKPAPIAICIAYLKCRLA